MALTGHCAVQLSSADGWGVLMALVVIVAPLWLAWLLLARGERKRDPDSEPKGRRPR